MNDLKDLVLLNFRNPRVPEYLQIISRKTGDPEQNFKDKFFVPLLKSLGFSALSEAHLVQGKVDYAAYRVGDTMLGFEVKPPTLNFRKKVEDVTYRDTLPQHFPQVADYLADPQLHYVVLTDGFSWYFFSKASARSTRKPYFLRLSGESLFRERALRKIEDLRANRIANTLQRWEDESQREPLNDLFFDSLRRWAGAMKEDCPKDDMARIITLINRFVFVRTLEDIGALPLYHLRSEMTREFEKWKSEEKKAKKFLGGLQEFIYDLYDTELFSGDLPIVSTHTLEAIIAGKPSKDRLFPRYLYDFSFTEMDFDVLGHVYERYLAELRRERGIFYTRRFVVDHILANTLGRGINQIISEAKKPLEKDDLSREDFEASKEAIKPLFDLRVLDPACGSGSFLVRAFELLMQGFEDWESLYRERAKAHPEAFGNFFRPMENSAPLSPDLKDWRQRLLLSCIHGVDLDARACEVAKMNLWLTLIKSEPEGYWLESIRSMDLGYVLPDLSLNILRGNSLVSLEIGETERILKEEFPEDMERIRNLSKLYQSNCRLQRGAVEEIGGIKANIRGQLQERLRKHWKGDETEDAVFWPLEFPFKFRYVVGNPPYIGEEDHKEIFRPVTACPLMAPFYMGKMDYWYFFVHLGLRLLENGGELSMITSSYWRAAAGAEKLRQDIMENSDIVDLVDFGEFKVFRESAPGQHNNIFRLKIPKEGAETGIMAVRDHGLHEEDIVNALRGEKIQGTEKWSASPLLDSGGLYFNHENTRDLLGKMVKETVRLGNLCFVGQGIVMAPENVRRKILSRLLDKEQPTDEEIETLEKKLGFRIGDGVFVLSSDEKSALRLTPKEEAIVKPYYSAREFKRFRPPQKNNAWVLYINSKLAKELKNDPARMPNITMHLDRFKPIITSNNKPYGLHCARREILFTSNQKIVSIRQTGVPTFIHVEGPSYVSLACNLIIPNEDCPVSPAALSAILNSSVAWFWFYHRGKRKGEMLQIDGKNLKAFPVALPDKKTDRKLAELAREIGRLKSAKEHLLSLWKQGSDNLPGPRQSLAEFLRERIVLTKTKALDDEMPILGLKIGFDEKGNAVIVGNGAYAFGDKTTALYTLYALDYWFRQTRKKTWGAFSQEIVLGTEGIGKLMEEIETNASILNVPANIADIRNLIREKSKEIDQLVSKLYSVEPPEGFRIWEVEDAL